MYYPQCNFCSCEYSDKLFHMVYQISQSSILYKKNFYISTDGYPICENHLLIVPFEHQFSFSNINRKNSEELEEVINYIIKKYNNCNNYILFEQGNNRKKDDKRTFGNSVIHAHIHFIPTQKMAKEKLIDYCFRNENTKLKLKENDDYKNCFFQCTKQKNFLDYLNDDLPTNEPYLFFHFNHEKMESLCITESLIDGEIPSQYFRKLFAIFMNPKMQNPFYNWKIPKEVQLSQSDRMKIINNIFLRFK